MGCFLCFSLYLLLFFFFTHLDFGFWFCDFEPIELWYFAFLFVFFSLQVSDRLGIEEVCLVTECRIVVVVENYLGCDIINLSCMPFCFLCPKLLTYHVNLWTYHVDWLFHASHEMLHLFIFSQVEIVYPNVNDSNSFFYLTWFPLKI